MMDNQKIGAFIAARRKEMGLTQQQLAERLGVTNKAVSKWESGNGIPDISLFTALAEVLGVTADELLRGEPSGSPAQEEAGPSGGEEPEDTEVTRAFELPENAEATRAFVLPEEHTSGETGHLEEAEAGGKASKRRRLVPLWAWIAGGVVLAVALAIGIGAFCLAGLSGTPVSGPSDPSGGASASSGLFTGALTEAETTTAAETTASSATSAPTTTTTTRTTTGTTVPLRPPLPNGASAEALTASAVLLYDASAGQTLYAYADTVQRDPASMTKLMTAIVALQYADVDTAHYVVGSEQSLVKKPDSSMAYLEQGWDMPLKALIHAMLLPSGCDAAYTVAVGVGRDVGGAGLSDEAAVQVFCDLMNQKAREIGAVNTHFSNPDGLRQGNLSTAQDILLIAQYAMQQPLIRETASRVTIRDTFTDTNGEEVDVTWDRNTNLLLDPDNPEYFEGTTGLKTGSSDTAGYCVVATASRNGRELIAVVMGSRSDSARWQDTTLLLEAGFAS